MNDSTASETSVPPARVHRDGTGWVTVSAAPEWWQDAAHSECWAETANELAALGEASVDPDLCRVIGTTTRRPCRYNTTTEPCPHHGEGNEANRCGAQTRKGGVCQWNVIVKGACPNHPEGWERFAAAEQEREEARRQQAAEALARREALETTREEAAVKLSCPYCSAGPGQECISPSTGRPASKIHTPRRRMLTHLAHAARAECPSCGAAKETTCTTSSGNVAQDAHSLRLDASLSAVQGDSELDDLL